MALGAALPEPMAPPGRDRVALMGVGVAGGAVAGPVPLAATLIRPEGRSAEVVAFETAVVSFFLEGAEILGVPKSVAAIYGVCFASPEPLSFADLNERLEISSGSISQGLRVLKEIGALKMVGAFDRREYFAPDMELRKVASHFLEERVGRQLKTGHQRLKEMKKLIPAGPAPAAGVPPSEATLRDRVKYLQSWHDKANAAVPLLRTFLKLT